MNMLKITETAPVTLSCKCYVFVCCGCDLLSVSSRNDALTCSTACRVRAHRSGHIKMLRELAHSLGLVNDDGKPMPAGIKQCNAIQRLRPDLSERITAGTLTIKQAQLDVYREFLDVLKRQIEADDDFDALQEASWPRYRKRK